MCGMFLNVCVMRSDLASGRQKLSNRRRSLGSAETAIEWLKRCFRLTILRLMSGFGFAQIESANLNKLDKTVCHWFSENKNCHPCETQGSMFAYPCKGYIDNRSRALFLERHMHINLAPRHTCLELIYTSMMQSCKCCCHRPMLIFG